MGKAILALADGAIFTGEAFGATGTTTGEAVFNTGMTGYQEALTDPSYAGQILTMTYPLIGNYGINADDFESNRVQVAGFVVRELSSEIYSNWRANMSLSDYLKAANVLGIAGVDTRALTRRIRSEGVMMAAVSTELSAQELQTKLQSGAEKYDAIDWVARVTTEKPYTWGPEESDATYRVSVLDCGIKFNILRELAKHGIRTTVFPAHTPASTMLENRMVSSSPPAPATLRCWGMRLTR
jgi:carbamoyl-phosphate synthase small subunit